MKRTLILIGVIILLTVACFTITKLWVKEKRTRIEKETILTSKDEQRINDSLQHVSMVKIWAIEKDDLKAAYEKSEKERSDYEKKLAIMYTNLKLSESKVKNVSAYYESRLESRDTVPIQMIGDCEIPPIRTKHYDLDFINTPAGMSVIHRYRTGQNIVITLFPKKKANGKNHWPNWGNLPWVGWDDTSVWTVEDQDAEITNQIAVKFKK